MPAYAQSSCPGDTAPAAPRLLRRLGARAALVLPSRLHRNLQAAPSAMWPRGIRCFSTHQSSPAARRSVQATMSRALLLAVCLALLACAASACDRACQCKKAGGEWRPARGPILATCRVYYNVDGEGRAVASAWNPHAGSCRRRRRKHSAGDTAPSEQCMRVRGAGCCQMTQPA